MLYLYSHNLFAVLNVVCTRSRNRRILNEDELLAAVAAVVPTDRIEFTGMTFRDQVCQFVPRCGTNMVDLFVPCCIGD